MSKSFLNWAQKLLHFIISFFNRQSLIKRTNVPYYDNNGAWKATVFAILPSEDSSGIIIAFDESTGDLITGDKQKKPAFARLEKEKYLEAKKWMLKWSKK